jgi:tRNA-dihydrouridine synthase A
MPSITGLPLSVAPMVDWTNTHFRILMRLIAPFALVYTEMEPLGAVLRFREQSLYFDEMEHPIALQIGGAEREGLVEAVKIAQSSGFDEINLNLGCPSHKVISGRFGACLMRQGEHVSSCIRAMKEVAQIPVTVKMRTGVDELDSYAFFENLAGSLIDAGADKLIIHARKAWLHGLNPKQNRTLPPLQYDYVYRLKATYPHVPIILNGQLNDLDVVKSALIDGHSNEKRIDGIMVGRLVYQDPYMLSLYHRFFYPDHPYSSRQLIMKTYLDYAYKQACSGVRLTILGKPIMNMAHGLPFAKRWKHALLEVMQNKIPQGFLELSQSYDSLFEASGDPI